MVMEIASALFSTTVVTAALGFAFWAFAAHFASAHVVGRSAAVISAMQFISAFATLGLHTLLIAELPRRDALGARRLVMTSVGIAFTAAFATAAGYALLRSAAAGQEGLYASAWGVVLFGIGTAVSTVAIVLDGAVIGMGLSRRQVFRNVVFAVVKLAALPLAAWAVGLSTSVIFTVWLVGNLISFGVLAIRVRSIDQWLTTPLSLRGFAPIWRFAAGHHWVNVATQAPRLALPVMVAVQVSDEANAGFFAALLIVSFPWILPNHLATAMFALSSGNLEQFHAGLNTTVRLSAVVSVCAAVGAPVLAGPLLAVFGPGYDDARYCLIALTTCTFANAVKSIYIAVRRAQGALGAAARATLLGSVLELGAAQIGLALGGVTGVGVGLGSALVVEAAFFWPVIARVRRERITPRAESTQTC